MAISDSVLENAEQAARIVAGLPDGKHEVSDEAGKTASSMLFKLVNDRSIDEIVQVVSRLISWDCISALSLIRDALVSSSSTKLLLSSFDQRIGAMYLEFDCDTAAEFMQMVRSVNVPAGIQAHVAEQLPDSLTKVLGFCYELMTDVNMHTLCNQWSFDVILYIEFLGAKKEEAENQPEPKIALDTDEQLRVAETILEQLGGKGMLSVMTGASKFVALAEGGVQFKVGRNGMNVNRIVIRLNGKDLYDLQFGRYGKKRNQPEYEFKVHNEFEDIFFDQLRTLFEENTGMYLTL